MALTIIALFSNPGGSNTPDTPQGLRPFNKKRRLLQALHEADASGSDSDVSQQEVKVKSEVTSAEKGQGDGMVKTEEGKLADIYI